VDETIEVSLERIRTIISTLDPLRFSTAEVIRGYCSGYFADLNTPAYYSFNAQFGKLFKRNGSRLGISQVRRMLRLLMTVVTRQARPFGGVNDRRQFIPPD